MEINMKSDKSKNIYDDGNIPDIDLPQGGKNKADDSFDNLDITNACSAYDCTGLIPRAPISDNEIESYEDIYNFEPPKPESE